METGQEEEGEQVINEGEDNKDEDNQEENTQENSAKAGTSKSVITEDYDFRELYVYKKDLPLPRDTEPEPAKKAKTEHFMGFSEEKHDDEVGVTRRKFHFHKAKIARIEGNPDRDLCKRIKKANKSQGGDK